MNLELKELIELIERRWHIPLSIIIVLVLTFCFFVYINSEIPLPNNIKFFIYLGFLILEIGFWFGKKTKLPKNKKNTYGIVIAINCDNKRDELNLKNDFISKIRENLNENKLSNKFKILELPRHRSEKLRYSDDILKDIEKLNKKMGADYFIHGDIKKKEDQYYINLKSHISNDSIEEKIKETANKDCLKILPKIKFVASKQLEEFELSANTTYLSIKYIVGLIALVTANYKLAEELHRGLHNEIKSINADSQEDLSLIKQRVYRLHLIEKYILALKCNEEENIEEGFEHVQYVLERDTENYDALLLKSQLDFKQGHIKEGIKTLKKAKLNSKGDGIWKYNICFLYLWDENYKEALKYANKIQKKFFEKENLVVEQVIDFNLKILEKRSDKKQLYFWIGFLNFYKLKDYNEANSWITRFLEENENSGLLENEAKKLLKEIESKTL